MAVILALEKLFAEVTARITADNTAQPVAQSFGWREPARQRASTRSIIWVPGDDQTGDVGKHAPPKYPGRIPNRPLGTLDELFTIYVAAQDPSAPADEPKQYHVTRLLLDELLRALYLAGRGTYEILKAGWVSPGRVQHSYGAAVRLVGAIQSMIPDYTQTGAPADTQAAITVEVLDLEDPVFEAPPDP